MFWTYERAPKAALSIETKRRLAGDRVTKALTVDEAHAALVDAKALEYLSEYLTELAVKQLDPSKDRRVRRIPNRPGQPIHISFREEPYTAVYRLDMVNRRALMIEFGRDGDRPPFFRPSDEL